MQTQAVQVFLIVHLTLKGGSTGEVESQRRSVHTECRDEGTGRNKHKSGTRGPPKISDETNQGRLEPSQRNDRQMEGAA